jgi:foldase protein PrsA
MTKKWLLTLATAALMVVLSACNSSFSDDVIVKTKAGEITKEEFYEKLKAQYGEQVLREMVETQLIEEAGGDVSEAEIDKKIAKIKENFPSDKEFNSALEQSQYKTEEELRKVIKRDLILFKMATKDIEVSDEDLENFYQTLVDQEGQVKASHILIKVEQGASEEDKNAAKQKAEEVLVKAKAGEDFAELAKTYSEGPSGPNGGELGFFTKGKMVPEFEAAAFSLNKGEISDLVLTDFGYHIIKVTDIKTFDKSLENDREEIREMFLLTKEPDTSSVVDELIKEGKIKVLDEDFEDLFEQK